MIRLAEGVGLEATQVTRVQHVSYVAKRVREAILHRDSPWHLRIRQGDDGIQLLFGDLIDVPAARCALSRLKAMSSDRRLWWLWTASRVHADQRPTAIADAQYRCTTTLLSPRSSTASWAKRPCRP